LAAASQSADRPVTAAKLLAYMQVFFVKYVIFGNDDPFRHKSIKKPVDVLHMVCTRLRAKLRNRTPRRFGGDRPRQNKQTRKYLVDIFQSWLSGQNVLCRM